jgi:hypothetical protein
MCDLDYVEAIVALVVAFAKNLARDHSFIR